MINFPEAEPCHGLCQNLSASVEFWRILDAMGIEDSWLIPSELSAERAEGDNRPRQFDQKDAGIRVERRTDYYTLYIRLTLNEEDIRNDKSKRVEIFPFAGAEPEQRAGDELLRASRLTSGPCLNALCRWLRLYGWKPGNELLHQSTTPAPPA